MTPRDLLVLAIGVLVGALLNGRREVCRRACCVTEARRQRWREGEDVAEGPRVRSEP